MLASETSSMPCLLLNNGKIVSDKVFIEDFPRHEEQETMKAKDPQILLDSSPKKEKETEILFRN